MDWVLAGEKQVQGLVRERNELRSALEGLVNAVKRYNTADAFSPGFDAAVARLHEQLGAAERVLEGGER